MEKYENNFTRWKSNNRENKIWWRSKLLDIRNLNESEFRISASLARRTFISVNKILSQNVKRRVTKKRKVLEKIDHHLFVIIGRLEFRYLLHVYVEGKYSRNVIKQNARFKNLIGGRNFDKIRCYFLTISMFYFPNIDWNMKNNHHSYS